MAAPHLQCVKPRWAWRTPREWPWLEEGQQAAFGRERLRLWPPSLLEAPRTAGTQGVFRGAFGDSGNRLCDRSFAGGFCSLFLWWWVVSFLLRSQGGGGGRIRGLAAQGRVATQEGGGLTGGLGGASRKPLGLRSVGGRREGDLTPLHF